MINAPKEGDVLRVMPGCAGLILAMYAGFGDQERGFQSARAGALGRTARGQGRRS
jgi:hypothetical protein